MALLTKCSVFLIFLFSPIIVIKQSRSEIKDNVILSG